MVAMTGAHVQLLVLCWACPSVCMKNRDSNTFVFQTSCPCRACVPVIASMTCSCEILLLGSILCMTTAQTNEAALTCAVAVSCRWADLATPNHVRGLHSGEAAC